MKKQPPTFETDGMQPDYIRELLDAGRAAATNDPAIQGYDVEAGIARHAALVQAGAPLPRWAEPLVASGSGVGAGAGAVAKLATGKLVAGIALAIVAAGTIAAVVMGAREKTARVAPPEAQTAPPAIPAVTLNDRASAPATHERAPGAEERSPEAIEIPDIAPVASRINPDLRGQPSAHGVTLDARRPEVDSKAAPARGNAPSTRSLEALIEAVGAQSSKGHVGLAAQSETVARSEPQAQGERASREPSGVIAPAPAPEPVIDDARLEREMGMLAVAQRVLKSDPSRALRLAEQGEKEFAGSMFTQERQQVLLLALIELGRIGDAKRLALPYLKRYPNGPFSDRLRSALAAATPAN